MFYFHIVDKQNNRILTSNLPDEFKNQEFDWDTIVRLDKCPVTGRKRRQKRIENTKYNIHVFTLDNSIGQRKFNTYIEICKFFCDAVFPEYLTNEETELKQVRRLKHNLITHSTNISNELFQIVPQESYIKGREKQIEYISSILKTDPDKSAMHLLRILKASTLMKAEFDVYDMLNSPNPILEFYNHKIHKVILLTMNSFWIDLVAKGITINIEQSGERIVADYKSIFVTLSHIFDNATKYCLENSQLDISFYPSNNVVSIVLDMLSLKVEDSEVQKMFNETYSGNWPSKLNLSGDGVGMYVVKKLMDLNEGHIAFENNKFPSKNVIHKGIPYESNRITLTYKMAVTNNR